jgi:multidrug efflux pump subunit AcrA (membrane-fusion protein)
MKLPGRFRRWSAIAVCAAALVIAAISHKTWWPIAQQWVQSSIASRRTNSTADEHGHASEGATESDAHAGHDHAHEESNSLELSAQAQGNLGLTPEFLRPIQLETFRRTLTVPGIVVARPGRSRMEVSTPMAGVIVKVHAAEGEAVEPGSPLFDIRITAEELVSGQTELLKALGDLDVENKEIARLSKISEVASKSLLERQYAKEKLENLLVAQREALRLHGLSNSQVETIVKERRLFRDLQIVAPQPGGDRSEIRLTGTSVVQASFREPVAGDGKTGVPLIITSMPVHVGQTVADGTTLAELTDYSELYIEGRTFEREVKSLSRVVAQGWPIAALFEGAERERETVENLELVYTAAEVDVESRMLPFFVKLPNQLVRQSPSPNGHSFVEWRFRPGRRVQLLVPIEELKDQIVLPVEAIVREGAESYVFQQNGKHFDRVPVRVTYRNSTHAVLANDGSVFPGDVVARVGAHQMQMALKNKSGGGVDLHAGHNH